VCHDHMAITQRFDKPRGPHFFPTHSRHGGRIAAAGAARHRAPCAPAGAGLVGQRIGRGAIIWAGAPEVQKSSSEARREARRRAAAGGGRDGADGRGRSEWRGDGSRTGRSCRALPSTRSARTPVGSHPDPCARDASRARRFSRGWTCALLRSLSPSPSLLYMICARACYATR